MFKWLVTYVKWGQTYKGYVLAWDEDSAIYNAERKFGKDSLPMVSKQYQLI